MFKKIRDNKLVNVITEKEFKKKLKPIFLFGYPIYWIMIKRPVIKKKISYSKLNLIIITKTD